MQSFAVWLLPEASVREDLEGWIRELAGRWGSRVFAPHVTVFSGARSLEGGASFESIRKRVEALARETRPMTLKVASDRLAYQESFFHAMYVPLEEPEGFEARLRNSLSKGVVLKPPPEGTPLHLSLIYQRFGPGVQARIREELLTGPLGRLKTITFDALCTLETRDPGAEISEMASWVVGPPFLLSNAK